MSWEQCFTLALKREQMKTFAQVVGFSDSSLEKDSGNLTCISIRLLKKSSRRKDLDNITNCAQIFHYTKVCHQRPDALIRTQTFLIKRRWNYPSYTTLTVSTSHVRMFSVASSGPRIHIHPSIHPFLYSHRVPMKPESRKPFKSTTPEQ